MSKNIKMGEIKERKPLVKVTLIGWREILTDVDLKKLEKAIEISKMVKINGILVNTSSISTLEPFEWDDMEVFILSISDPIVRSRLREILEERKSKHFLTNWVQHLISIYSDRFWEITIDKK